MIVSKQEKISENILDSWTDAFLSSKAPATRSLCEEDKPNSLIVMLHSSSEYSHIFSEALSTLRSLAIEMDKIKRYIVLTK